MRIWIVGRDVDSFYGSWEIQGAYSTEAAAVARCEGPDWFIGPLDVDVAVASETAPWPACYRPASQPE